MELTCKYKIEISDEKIFDELGKQLGVEFPEDLKAFIMAYNASMLDKKLFMLGTDEKVFGTVLSFNREDEEQQVDTVFSAPKEIDMKKYLPFGMDPAGNYICYALKDGGIWFWIHENEEEDAYAKIGDNLEGFLESLY